jgi:hypothetical protein
MFLPIARRAAARGMRYAHIIAPVLTLAVFFATGRRWVG